MPSFKRYLPLGAALTALVATTAMTSGCSPIRLHKGYIGEPVLIDSIQPGVDNRASVTATLGRPTFTSQFTGAGETPVWYYVSRDTRQLAFNRPTPVSQTILAVHFDGAGTVSDVDRIGLEQVASIDPYNRETPTLGREINFFQELFGNIGQAGAIGEAGTTADNPDGR